MNLKKITSIFGSDKIFVYEENNIFDSDKFTGKIKKVNDLSKINSLKQGETQQKIIEYTEKVEEFSMSNHKKIDPEVIVVFNEIEKINIENLNMIGFEKAVFAPVNDQDIENIQNSGGCFLIKDLIMYDFNKEQLLLEFAGSEQLLKKVTDVNLKHFPSTFKSIKDSIQEGEYKNAAKHSHTLRGSLGIFFDQGTRFWDILKEIEAHCKHDDIDRSFLLKKIKETELILLGFDYYFKNYDWNIEE